MFPQSPLSCKTPDGFGNQDPDVRHQFSQIARAMTGRISSVGVVSKPGVRLCCSWLSPLVLSPLSRKCMFWDSMRVLILLIDVMNTPLVVFKEEETEFDAIFGMCFTVFWTVDILVSFFHGYTTVLGVELRPWVIAGAYLKGAFWPEVLIVAVDWVFFFADNQVSAASFLRAARIAKMLRVVRLTRVMKLPKTMDGILHILPEGLAPNLMSIGMPLVTILILNHFIACAWYAIGQATTPSWVELLDEEGRSIAYRYFTSFHWSVTQFTPSSMEVGPRNTYERVFAVCVIILAIGLFPSFLNTITATMLRMRDERLKQKKQKEAVKSYIEQNSLSFDLSSRISAFLQTYKFSSRRRTHRSDIALFKVLPKRLVLMLDCEVYGPMLMVHPLFHRCCDVDPASFLQICNDTLAEVSVASCEELFHTGQEATAMYFTISGVMRLYKGLEDSVKPDEFDGATRKFLCEPALWMRWTHRGRLCAVTNCEYVALTAAALHKVVLREPRIMAGCLAYAKMYQRRMAALLASDGVICGDYERDITGTAQRAAAAFRHLDL